MAVPARPLPPLPPPLPQAPPPQAPAPGYNLPAGYAQVPGRDAGNIVCAPGLEYLASIDLIIVEQHVELVEALLGCETSNRYIAKNSVGQTIYDIKEISPCCGKLCCGPRRCFEMDMFDHKGTSVIHLTRPLRCAQCCCFCCLQELIVQAPPRNTIAYVNQNFSICYPTFTIYDRNYKPALTILGPICTQSLPCCGDVKFEVRSMNGVVIGAITKTWSGLVKEFFTDADNFGVSFPKDLDVHLKASLLAAAVLIDYMFFEKAYGQSDDLVPGMVG